MTTCPVSPEYAFKNDQPLSQFIYAGRKGTGEKSASDKTRIVEAAKKHPLFQNGEAIANMPPALLGELGRYPDAYITRLLEPYLSYAKAKGLFSLIDEKILPIALEKRLGLLNGDSLEYLSKSEHLKHIETPTLIPVIKEDILGHLLNHLTSSPSMGHRYRTMMYWYFKESLRYGSHSRLSMLYDQVQLDMIVETILGVTVIAHSANQDQSNWCQSI